MIQGRVLFFARGMGTIDRGNGKSAHDVVRALREIGCDVRLPLLSRGREWKVRWRRFLQRRFLTKHPLGIVNGAKSIETFDSASSRLPGVAKDVVIIRESPMHFELIGQAPAARASAFNQFRHRIFVSSIAREKWLGYGVTSENSHYLPNTLVEPALPPGGGVDPDLALLEPGRTNVLVVATVQPRKGQDMVIDAVSSSPALTRRFRFVFVGPCESPYALEQRARTAGRPEFLFVGPKANVRDWYEATDIVLQPSRAEAMSRVMLEALMCGKPFVGTDIEGAGEVIRDGIDGLLFPVDDTRALEERLLRLEGDADERAALAARGRRRFEEEYAWERYVERWRALLPRLLS